MFAKDILVEVDAQVAEKEKEDRKLEIYNRIEAKSFTIYRGHKFKKSDIFLENRKLKYVPNFLNNFIHYFHKVSCSPIICFPIVLDLKA